MSAKIHTLTQAQAPARDAMLEMIDRTRAEIERGDAISIMMIVVAPDREFCTRAEGEVRSLELIGMLETLKHDLIRAMD